MVFYNIHDISKILALHTFGNQILIIEVIGQDAEWHIVAAKKNQLTDSSLTVNINANKILAWFINNKQSERAKINLLYCMVTCE